MSKVSPLTNIPNKNSQASAWIEWHKTLKDNFGRKQANALFIKAWQRQGDTFTANTHELREYLSKNGINIEKNIASAVFDSGADVFDSIGDFMQVGKYVVIALGVITIGGLALAVYNIAKNPVGTIGAVRGGK